MAVNNRFTQETENLLKNAGRAEKNVEEIIMKHILSEKHLPLKERSTLLVLQDKKTKQISTVENEEGKLEVVRYWTFEEFKKFMFENYNI